MKKSYDRWILITWWIIGISAVGTICVFIFPLVKNGAWWVVFCMPLLLFAGILQPFLYQWRSKTVAGIAAFMNGKHLAHWTYELDEWRTFAESEWKRAKRKSLWTPIGVVAILAIYGWFFTDMTTDQFFLVISIVFAVAVAGSGLALWIAHSTYTRTMENAGEVFIGETGVMVYGTYTPWNVFGARRGKVQFFEGDPAVLQIDVVYAGRGRNTAELRIPVPRRQHEEAKRLVERFSGG